MDLSLMGTVPGSAVEQAALVSPWRIGRSIGRTVYVMVGPEPSKDDLVLGMMDTLALAAEVVAAHNAKLYADARD